MAQSSNNPALSTAGTSSPFTQSPCYLPNKITISTTRNSLQLFMPLNLFAITLNATLNFLKFGQTTTTSPTSTQNRNSHAAKLAGHCSSPNSTSPSSTNQEPSIKQMLCPGGQTIKRGCLLQTNHKSFSAQSSFQSTLHNLPLSPQKPPRYDNTSKKPSSTTLKSARQLRPSYTAVREPLPKDLRTGTLKTVSSFTKDTSMSPRMTTCDEKSSSYITSTLRPDTQADGRHTS